MQIAIVGSRSPLHGTAVKIFHLIKAAKLSNHSIVTGCCRGVDTIVKNTANNLCVPCRVIKSLGTSPQALRTRTAAVIKAASAIYVLPSHNRVQHSGSFLATSLAVKADKPVCVLPPTTLQALPTWSTVPAWQSIPSFPPQFTSLYGWARPIQIQQSLFGQSCPECQGQIINQSAYNVCQACGWSACG